MPNLPEGEYIDFELQDKRGNIVVNAQSGEIVLFSLVADLKDVPSSILITGKNKLKEMDPKMAQVRGAYRGQDAWILQGQNFASVIALVNPKGTFHTFEQQPMKGLKN